VLLVAARPGQAAAYGRQSTATRPVDRRVHARRDRGRSVGGAGSRSCDPPWPGYAAATSIHARYGVLDRRLAGLGPARPCRVV